MFFVLFLESTLCQGYRLGYIGTCILYNNYRTKQYVVYSTVRTVESLKLSFYQKRKRNQRKKDKMRSKEGNAILNIDLINKKKGR